MYPKSKEDFMVTKQRIGFVMVEFLNKGGRKEKRLAQRLSLLLMTQKNRAK